MNVWFLNILLGEEGLDCGGFAFMGTSRKASLAHDTGIDARVATYSS